MKYYITLNINQTNMKRKRVLRLFETYLFFITLQILVTNIDIRVFSN